MILGHPPGLAVLFLTEMWERFSYYGMRALLIYYLTRHFLMNDGDAAILYGSYTAMVYALPVIGGLIADRYLGARKSVTLGALLLTAGHFVMAFEGDAAMRIGGEVVRDAWGLQTLYLALALIAVGVGLLKPNISIIVGKLYAIDDPRRSGAFTIFYMGINLGAAVATVLCGYLGETYGWPYGFGAAGIGMLFGLLIFLSGQKYLHGHAEPPAPDQLKQPWLGLNLERWLWVGILVAVFIVWRGLQYDWLVQGFLVITAVACAVGLALFAFLACRGAERANMLIMMLLIFFSVFFWSLFEQAGTSLSLFAERNLDRSLFGYEIKPSQFQAVNPAFIMLLAPLFAWFWGWCAASKREPSLPIKFAFAIILVGLGFYALIIGANFADSDGQVAMVWLVLAYFLHTTGELCLSPVGLAMVTQLSVARIVGIVMGVWFLSSAFAANLGALIARTASLDQVDGSKLTGTAALEVYTGLFANLGQVALVIGLGLLIAAPWLAKHIRIPKSSEDIPQAR